MSIECLGVVIERLEVFRGVERVFRVVIESSPNLRFDMVFVDTKQYF